MSLGKPGVYAAVTGSIRLESLFLTLAGSGFELVVCVKFSKLVVGAGTGSFQVNSNIPLFDRLAEFSVYSNLNPCASTERIIDLPHVTSCSPGPVSLSGALISWGYFRAGGSAR